MFVWALRSQLFRTLRFKLFAFFFFLLSLRLSLFDLFAVFIQGLKDLFGAAFWNVLYAGKSAAWERPAFTDERLEHNLWFLIVVVWFLILVVWILVFVLHMCF